MKNPPSRISKEFSLIKSAQPLEFYGGLLFLAGIPLIILLMFAARLEVSGENAWIKPGKFFFSTALYVCDHGMDSTELTQIESWHFCLEKTTQLVDRRRDGHRKYDHHLPSRQRCSISL